jgi:MarR family transcriptional regulator, 2-MHQ and catechol-resistance regulon repressor
MSKKDTSLKTFLKLIRASESAKSRVYTPLAKYNLSESQINVMEALYNLGSLTQKQLGSKIFKSGGNITMVIDNLEKQGVVIRKRGKPDRRYYIIELTEKGKNKMKKVFPELVKNISEEMKILSEQEQEELQRLTKAIGLKRK